MKNFNTLLLIAMTISLGLTISTSHAQNALDFDGTDDYVSVPGASNVIANKNMSLSFWVYPRNTSPGYPNFDGIAGFRNNTNADFYILHLNATSVEARFRNSSGIKYDIVYSGINVNAWNHFVFTYDGSMLTLYHDGVSVGTQAASGTISSTTEALNIGYLPFNSPNFYLNGQLDDVALWTKALNGAEVTTMYNACAIDLSMSSLALCYEFNQGSAGGNNSGITAAVDSKGAINGTLNNFALSGTGSNYIAYSKNGFSTVNASICGGSYTSPAGNILTMSGTYTDTIPTSSGCDSLITINLTAGMPSSSTINPTVCEMYLSSGGNIYTTSGTYTNVISNASGCDSTITINLTVNNESSATISPLACETYTSPSGMIYTASGTYTDVIPNAAGCDSTITINLTIGNSSATITETACLTYTSPSGKVWTTSGNYTDTITNAVGCDSLLTIELIINPLPNVMVTQNKDTLTADASGATYQWLDCLNALMPISGETNQTYIAPDGEYAVVVTVNGCSDTSNCYTVTTINTVQTFQTPIKVYPNPTQGSFLIDLGVNYTDVTVQITDVIGRVVQNEHFTNSKNIEINMSAPTGVYFVEIRSEDKRQVIKLIKE